MSSIPHCAFLLSSSFLPPPSLSHARSFLLCLRYPGAAMETPTTRPGPASSERSSPSPRPFPTSTTTCSLAGFIPANPAALLRPLRPPAVEQHRAREEPCSRRIPPSLASSAALRRLILPFCRSPSAVELPQAIPDTGPLLQHPGAAPILLPPCRVLLRSLLRLQNLKPCTPAFSASGTWLHARIDSSGQIERALPIDRTWAASLLRPSSRCEPASLHGPWPMVRPAPAPSCFSFLMLGQPLFRPAIFFPWPCEFCQYSRVYGFTEKPLVFMHIITYD